MTSLMQNRDIQLLTNKKRRDVTQHAQKKTSTTAQRAALGSGIFNDLYGKTEPLAAQVNSMTCIIQQGKRGAECNVWHPIPAAGLGVLAGLGAAGVFGFAGVALVCLGAAGVPAGFAGAAGFAGVVAGAAAGLPSSLWRFFSL